MRILWVITAMTVFIAFVMLNPAALAELLWFAMRGAFGRTTQIATLAGGAVAALLMAAAFRPRRATPPKPAGRAATRKASRGRGKKAAATPRKPKAARGKT